MDPATRYPPPYPRRRSATPVVGGIRGRTYYFRRCKKVEATNIESLPIEVLTEILMRLSIDEILEKARFVCRKWYHIIHSHAFIQEYSNSNSNWGFLFTSRYREEQPLFLGVREGGRIELSKLYHKSYVPIPVSCNGLGVSYSCGSKSFELINLATKQAFSSPPTLAADDGVCSFGMVYAAASMEYKLVRTYRHLHSATTVCHIFTVGVDNNWRSVGVDHLSSKAKKPLIMVPLITQGFMHWTWYWNGIRVLNLNAETEMITESYVPLLPHPVDDAYPPAFPRRIIRRHEIFVSMGRRLCLFSPCGDRGWEVWEMEGDSGEWRKLLPKIDLEGHTRRLKQELLSDNDIYYLEPLGWLQYPVLLVLHIGTTCIVYNVATDEIDCSFKLPHSPHYYVTTVHKNTLEWLR